METVEYDPNAWQRLGDKFTNNYEQGMLGFRHAIIDKICMLQGYRSSLLEMACADGWFIQQLRRRHYRGKYLGVDITPGLIQRARDNCPHEEFKVMDARNMMGHVENESHDFVLCAGLLMHLDDPENAIFEACRVSSKYVMLSTYGKYGGMVTTPDVEHGFVNNYYNLEVIQEMVPTAFNLIEFKAFPRSAWYMFQFLYERD